jgi:hypothetical protein
MFFGSGHHFIFILVAGTMGASLGFPTREFLYHLPLDAKENP